MAKGYIIKYMSDDDVLTDGVFAYATSYFAANPEVDILFGQSHWIDERGEGAPYLCDNRPRTDKSITATNFIRSNYPQVNSETAFIRSRVISKIGLFDTTLQGADYEYWLRALKAGLNVKISDLLMVEYHISSLSGVVTKEKKLLRERLLLADRYGTPSDKWFLRTRLIPYRLAVRALSRLLPPLENVMRRRWRISRLSGQGKHEE
jgi:GT2 family glycosyltransferase